MPQSTTPNTDETKREETDEEISNLVAEALLIKSIQRHIAEREAKEQANSLSKGKPSTK